MKSRFLGRIATRDRNLVVKRQGLCCPVQDDGLNGGGVEPGRQNGDRAENCIGLSSNHSEISCRSFSLGIVQVHALVPLFDEHGLNLLGGVDALLKMKFGAWLSLR